MKKTTLKRFYEEVIERTSIIHLLDYRIAGDCPFGNCIIGSNTFHRITSPFHEYDKYINDASVILTKANIEHEICRDEWNRLTIYIPADLEQ